MNITTDDNRRPLCFPDFARYVHKLNEKWWVDLNTGERIERNEDEMVMLMVSEAAECLEGVRKNLADDKLPHLSMEVVECADILIRMADFSAGTDKELVDWLEDINDPDYSYGVWDDFSGDTPPAEMLLAVTHAIVDTEGYGGASWMQEILFCVEMYAVKRGFADQLWQAVWEKLDYNVNRADHQLEARRAANGKKF